MEGRNNTLDQNDKPANLSSHPNPHKRHSQFPITDKSVKASKKKKNETASRAVKITPAIDYEAFKDQFNYNEEETSAWLDLSKYEKKQISIIVGEFKNRRRRRNLSFLEIVRAKNTLSINVNPNEPLPIDFNLRECIKNLCEKKKSHFDWKKAAYDWMNKEKTIVKITHEVFSTVKGLNAFKYRIDTHPNYGSGIISVMQLKNGSISAVFFDNITTFKGKNLKECIEEIINFTQASAITAREDFVAPTFSFKESENIAKLTCGSYPDARTLCLRLNVKLGRITERLKYFSVISLSSRNGQATASIRKGQTLPEGITLQMCLEKLGLRNADKDATVTPIPEPECLPTVTPASNVIITPNLSSEDFFNRSVSYILKEDGSAAINKGNFNTLYELRSSLNRLRKKLIEENKELQFLDKLHFPYTKGKSDFIISLKKDCSLPESYTLADCLNLLGLQNASIPTKAVSSSGFQASLFAASDSYAQDGNSDLVQVMAEGSLPADTSESTSEEYLIPHLFAASDEFILEENPLALQKNFSQASDAFLDACDDVQTDNPELNPPAAVPSSSLNQISYLHVGGLFAPSEGYTAPELNPTELFDVFWEGDHDDIDFDDDNSRYRL